MNEERRAVSRPRVKAPPTSSSPQRIDLDWKAYFIEFCRVHGEPVVYQGRLLFRDGWSYSRTDYQGPEWAPSLDHRELDTMVCQYWVIRKGMVERSLDEAVGKLLRMQNLKSIKSIPLQQVVKTEEGKGYRPLDLSGLETRIQWLREDLAECIVRLTEIASERDKYKPTSPPIFPSDTKEAS